jgi:hypothetical protein
MITYTPNELLKVQEYAGLYLSIEDIAAIMEWNEADLKSAVLDKNCPIRKAFIKGRALTEVQLRTSIQKNANRGSVPAQNTLLDWIKKKEDIDYE